MVHNKHKWCLIICLMPLLMSVCAAASQYAVFTDSFDDGDWTHQPRWEYVTVGPVSVSSERFVSSPYSLKVATANEQGAIRALSGLSSANQPFSCMFNLYIESLGDEAIPWGLESSSGLAAIIFILPGGTVQLFVLDSTSTWSGKTSQVPYPITYGQWHSFRLTYDGLVTRLYLDGHTEPDASVSQQYVRSPTRVCIGNISLPHTSTFFVDDLIFYTDTQPARVYVQMCSDTSTSGINVSSLYSNFPEADWTYTSPDGQAAQVMAESYRDQLRDSMGNPIKFTWYMLVGSLYAFGIDTGPLLSLELMMDNHGDAIARWGDEMAYHYHTWIWSDPDCDGVYHWNQAPDFSYCVDDFEETVAHMVLDRCIFPSSFRSGWHGMDNFFQAYLDDWFPYRFENAWPSYREDPTEPVDNVFDWRRATSEWVPYHPNPNDYQSVGSLRGWESRCQYMNNLDETEIENIFLKALGGTPQVVTAWSHLKEADFPVQVSNLHTRFSDMHDKLPCVHFEYLTGRECMRRWRNGTDTNPPTIEYTFSDNAGMRTVLFSTDEEIYQVRPFIARRTKDGVYERVDADQVGTNQWKIEYFIPDTDRIAVAVTDWFGNPRVQFLPTPLTIRDIQVSTTTTSADIRWETNNPADTRVGYSIALSGGLTEVYEASSTLAHHVRLTNLLPGKVYCISISAEDVFGQRAEAEPVYVLTNSSEPVIIDNLDAGFSVSGSWSTGSTAGDKYGSDYRYAGTSPSGTSKATWTWEVTETGTYEISAWWSQGTNRSSSATYSVVFGGNQYFKTMNQQVDGGKWNALGVYELEAGTIVQVQLSNNAPSGFVVIADAVKFERPFTPVPTLGLARRLPCGEHVLVSDVVVTGVFGDGFYVEDSERCAGMRVEGSGVSVGDVVDVSGTLTDDNVERILANPIVRKTGEGCFLKPLGITGRSISLNDLEQVCTVGLLVTLWGRVTTAGDGWFYVDDGAGLRDGTGNENVGVKVDAHVLGVMPEVGSHIFVTGVLSTELTNAGVVPVLRLRSDSDLRLIQ